jgi:hypothetical protein
MSSAQAPVRSAVTGRTLTLPVIAVVSALALIISLSGIEFLALSGKTSVTFGDLRTATSPAAAPGLQHAYFGWLAWTLTIIAIVGLATALFVPVAAAAARIGVIVVSLVGVVLTLGCVKELDVEDPAGGFWTHFGWIRFGGYLHVVGWVLAIVVCVLATMSARED